MFFLVVVVVVYLARSRPSFILTTTNIKKEDRRGCGQVLIKYWWRVMWTDTGLKVVGGRRKLQRQG